MSNVCDILHKIAITDSTNGKQSLMERERNNETLKRIFKMTYDNSIIYGVRLKAENIENRSETIELETALDVLENEFATRKLTGNAAKEKLMLLYKSLGPAKASVLSRVISRDLECGASSSLANNVWPKLIPKQPQALCNSYNTKNISYIQYPAYAQLKADGARCFTRCEIDDDGLVTITQTTRANNEYHGLGHIKDEITRLIKKHNITESFDLDGELTYYIKGENTVQSRQYGNGLANSSIQGGLDPEEALGFKYDLWDIIPTKEVLNGVSTKQYHERFYELGLFCDDSSIVVPIENHVVGDVNQAIKIYRSYVDQGLEGIILKNIHMLWKDGRLKDQVKFKEFHTADMKVIGYKLHSKDSNKIGSVLLSSSCGAVSVSVGSGFKDKPRVRNPKTKEWEHIPLADRPDDDREKMLANWDSINGTIVEVEFNKLSLAEGDESTYSLYLPTFVKFRFDKTEANSLNDLIEMVGEKNVPVKSPSSTNTINPFLEV